MCLSGFSASCVIRGFCPFSLLPPDGHCSVSGAFIFGRHCALQTEERRRRRERDRGERTDNGRSTEPLLSLSLSRSPSLSPSPSHSHTLFLSPPFAFRLSPLHLQPQTHSYPAGIKQYDKLTLLSSFPLPLLSSFPPPLPSPAALISSPGPHLRASGP